MFERLIGVFAVGYLLGGLATLWYVRGKSASSARSILGKFYIYVLVGALMLVSIYFYYPFLALAFLIVALGLYEVVVNRKRSVRHLGLSLLLYTTVAAGFMAFAWRIRPEEIMLTYAAAVAMDGFSQISGQLFGKTPWVPKISPSKTWEGFLGGLSLSLLLYWGLQGFEMDRLGFLAFLLLLLAAQAGDLLASVYKRQVGVKDFSRLIPFHGGVLDRFDSFMMAGCVASLWSAWATA
ncbi:phosphatidate cytidylyltransferase [Curvibacter sp. HBC61]|uniref:Phosphatidate cytidylyltransferase n=1 Tax=Curvibacter cyanobacteriorum TaxID=3026422 RepID=A0ABT5N6W6_9BURK|nr:phosphatidate cytidylyltransferase [Curvibacter sp. HBC61]MDD0840877.1 phosphatidate cytidylyltransferase [Curvibacter sp. HBC61]